MNNKYENNNFRQPRIDLSEIASFGREGQVNPPSINLSKVLSAPRQVIVNGVNLVPVIEEIIEKANSALETVSCTKGIHTDVPCPGIYMDDDGFVCCGQHGGSCIRCGMDQNSEMIVDKYEYKLFEMIRIKDAGPTEIAVDHNGGELPDSTTTECTSDSCCYMTDNYAPEWCPLYKGQPGCWIPNRI